MALISDRDRKIIGDHFEEHLPNNIEIIMFTERESKIIVPGRQECIACRETEELLKEVGSLSDRIDVKVHELESARDEAAIYGIDRVPAFVVKGTARGNVRFFGIPSGHEFTAFIADLVDVSKGTTDLSEETRQYLAGLTTDVNIKVFTTPT